MSHKVSCQSPLRSTHLAELQALARLPRSDPNPASPTHCKIVFQLGDNDDDIDVGLAPNEAHDARALAENPGLPAGDPLLTALAEAVAALPINNLIVKARSPDCPALRTVLTSILPHTRLDSLHVLIQRTTAPDTTIPFVRFLRDTLALPAGVSPNIRLCFRPEDMAHASIRNAFMAIPRHFSTWLQRFNTFSLAFFRTGFLQPSRINYTDRDVTAFFRAWICVDAARVELQLPPTTTSSNEFNTYITCKTLSFTISHKPFLRAVPLTAFPDPYDVLDSNDAAPTTRAHYAVRAGACTALVAHMRSQRAPLDSMLQRDLLCALANLPAVNALYA